MNKNTLDKMRRLARVWYSDPSYSMNNIYSEADARFFLGDNYDEDDETDQTPALAEENVEPCCPAAADRNFAEEAMLNEETAVDDHLRRLQALAEAEAIRHNCHFARCEDLPAAAMPCADEYPAYRFMAYYQQF